MTCEVFLSEMYKQRAGEDLPLMREFQEHLRTCPACAKQYAGMVEQDAFIRRVVRGIAVPEDLDQKVRLGLLADRFNARTEDRKPSFWRLEFLVPLALALLVIVGVTAKRQWHSHQVSQIAATMLRNAPALEFISEERSAILTWSGQHLNAQNMLPPRLSRVQFRGAASVSTGKHSAVFLQMKREPRASLLILNQTSGRGENIALRSTTDGSYAFWSEGSRTYVLLFHGSQGELNAYMDRMGITTGSASGKTSTSGSTAHLG